MAAEFRLLGPVEADLDGQLVDLGPARQRCVLVALLVDAGHVVPVDQLVDRVWGDHPPRRVRETLYSYLSRLRTALATRVELLRRSGGYLLETGKATVDLHRFRRLVAEARRTTDDEGTGAALEKALRLWRGEAFAGLDTPWLDQLRTTLDAERRAAELEHTDVMLRLGRQAELLADLATLAAEHPLDERLAGQLMLAFYRSGRQADALTAYDDIRAALETELGIVPGAPLVELRQAILTGDPTLVAPPPATTDWPVRRHLPLDVGDFVGRTEELARVEELVTGGTSLVTISGSPGVGKTAFAVRAGHRLRARFPDGQWFVGLGGARDPRPPAGVLGELLRNCGVDESDQPAGLEDRAAELRSRLADRRVLLVLDDAASSDQVSVLLPGTSGSAVLVTSRHTLRGLGVRFAARPLTLDVLTAGDATALLAGILGREAASTAAAAELARLCAYLPLALRIAAANLTGRTLPRYVSGLRAGSRLDKLAIATDPALAVRVAIDYSYAGLEPGPRRLFRLLGLVPGADFTDLAAAALLGADRQPAVHAVELLADANLIQRSADDRYTFHDLLREYAVDAATAEETDAERRAAVSRLLKHYAAATATAVGRLYPQDPDPDAAATDLPDEPAAWLRAEMANLLASAAPSFRYASAAHTLRLSALLRRYLRDSGRYADARALHSTALDVAGDQADRLGALTRLGETHRLVGQHEQAAQCSHEAVELARAIGEPTAELVALADLGRVRHLQGRFEQAVEHLERAHQLARRIGDRWAELAAIGGLGRVYITWGRHRHAAAFLERELELARLVGHHTAESAALASLGRVHYLDDRFDQAADFTEQAIRLARSRSDPFGVVVALTSLGGIRHRQGRHGDARRHFEEVLDIARETGDRNAEFEGRYGIGRVECEAGDPRVALRQLQQAAGLATAIGQPADLARAYDAMAHAQHRLGNSDDARRYWRQALDILDGLGTEMSEDVSAEEIRKHL